SLRIASCVSSFSDEVIESKSSRRSAVRSSAWLGVLGMLDPIAFWRLLVGKAFHQVRRSFNSLVAVLCFKGRNLCIKCLSRPMTMSSSRIIVDQQEGNKIGIGPIYVE